MRKLIATWASGEEFCHSIGFNAYLKSLKVFNDNHCEKVVFTHDMPQDVRDQLISLGIVIQDVDPSEVHFLIRDRNLAYWKYLVSNLDRYYICIFTDSKDVIFQADPFNIFRASDFCALVGEGMTHSQSGWNAIDQYECQRNVREFGKSLSDESVINGGVIVGTPSRLRDLFFLLWSNTVRAIGKCTEQAVLNYLYQFLKFDQDFYLCDPKSSNLCVTGEAIKEGHFKPLFEGGKFLHPTTRVPYSIIHQYERTEYKEAVLAQYLN